MIASNFYLKKLEDLYSSNKEVLFLKFCNHDSLYDLLSGDHITLLNIFNTWRIKKRSTIWAAKNLLNYKLLEACDKIREQLVSNIISS